MIFLLRGRQSGHLYMYVRFIIHNWESHLSFFQKWSSYGKNRVNSKFYMGEIGVVLGADSMLPSRVHFMLKWLQPTATRWPSGES